MVNRKVTQNPKTNFMLNFFTFNIYITIYIITFTFYIKKGDPKSAALQPYPNFMFFIQSQNLCFNI